jgi:Tfp pilus assembly protein PilV
MRGQRGATLIELMVASVVLLIALIGFVTAMNAAGMSNAIGHRRTVETYLRNEVIERFAVSPRAGLDLITPSRWMVDGCFDVESQPVASNPAHDPDFACPAGATYRSWLRIEPSGSRTWTVRSYVERTESPCGPDNRRTSISCAAADVVLTD